MSKISCFVGCFIVNGKRTANRESVLPTEDEFSRVFKLRSSKVMINRQHELNRKTLPCQGACRHYQIT